METPRRRKKNNVREGGVGNKCRYAFLEWLEVFFFHVETPAKIAVGQGGTLHYAN